MIDLVQVLVAATAYVNRRTKPDDSKESHRMKQWGMEYLACPITGQTLKMKGAVYQGEEIMEGKLVSPEGREFPIRSGIPRFAALEGSQSSGSVESFGFEWNTLNFDSFYINWHEHIVKGNFGSLDFFKDKVVLDCGGGSGMHSRWLLEAGARQVITLELSQTVDGIMRKNLQGFGDRSLVVQCDIAKPPIQKGSVDVVYCMNVIQHTVDPVETTRRLYQLLGGKTELFINYYMQGDDTCRSWKFKNLLRDKVLSLLPQRILLSLCRIWGLMSLVPGLDYLLMRFLLIRGSEVPPGPNFLQRKYKQTVLNTYDWYGSHDFQHYYTYKELKKLFSEAGIPSEKVLNYEEVINSSIAGKAFRFAP